MVLDNSSCSTLRSSSSSLSVRLREAAAVLVKKVVMRNQHDDEEEEEQQHATSSSLSTTPARSGRPRKSDAALNSPANTTTTNITFSSVMICFSLTAWR